MITERDENLLVELDGLRYITARHCVGVFYPSLRVAQRRLQELIEQDQLSRYASGRCSEYVYHLPKRKPGQQIRHILACLDLWSVCRTKDSLTHWESERVIDFRFMGKAYTLRPDALFAINDTLFAYEYEPTPIKQRIIQKISQYENWAASRDWKETFGKFPHILIHTPKRNLVKDTLDQYRRDERLRWEICGEVSGWLADTLYATSNTSSNIRWR